MMRARLAVAFLLALAPAGCGPADQSSGPPPSSKTTLPWQGFSSSRFDSDVNTAVITGGGAQTGGAPAGIICFLFAPGEEVPTILTTNASLGTTCAVEESNGLFRGRAGVPDALVNRGYSIRIVLLWIPGSGAGAWDY